jgi:hypothetical protein
VNIETNVETKVETKVETNVKTLHASVLSAPPKTPLPSLAQPLEPEQLASALQSFSTSWS